MKIGFFTENGFNNEKITRNYPHARTEFAWMIAMDATHYNIYSYLQDADKESYKCDIGIFIPPKNPATALQLNKQIVLQLKDVCGVLAIMQEGPNWYFQDMESVRSQFEYIEMLQTADFLLCHNKIDRDYYSAIKPIEHVHVMQSLVIEDTISDLIKQKPSERRDIMIGGNFSSWYSGMDSYLVATHIASDNDGYYFPSMGRCAKDESECIVKIPHTNWADWMKHLNSKKAGVHFMKTFAAGTFALNCAVLGIPCFGYRQLDTQNILHPSTSFDSIGDAIETTKLIVHPERYSYKQMGDVLEYYGNQAQSNYREFYHENIFRDNIKKTLDKYI